MANGNEKTNKSWFKAYGIEIIGGILLAVLITLLFPRGKSFQFADLREGRVYVGSEIIAPFTFFVNKSEEEYSADIKKARENVVPVFEKTDTELPVRLENFLDRLLLLLKNQKTTKEDIGALFREYGIIVSGEDILFIISGFQGKITNTSLRINAGIVQRRVRIFETLSETIKQLVKELYSAGIINIDKNDLSSNVTKLSIRQGREEIFEELVYYNDVKEAKNILLEKLRSVLAENEKQIKICYQIASNFIVPNVIYNKQETDSRIEDAVANVPLAKDQVLAGERIIDSHERITRQHIDKLHSLAIAKAEQGQMSGFWSRLTPYIGKFFMVCSILGLLVLFLYRQRRSIFQKKKLLLVALIFLIISLFSYVFDQVNIPSYLIPVSIGAIIVTIFFDTYTGFLTSLSVSLLVGAMKGDEYGITVVSIIVCTVAIISVSRVRTRNWILRSMAMIAGAYLVSITIHGFVSYTPFKVMLVDWGYGVANGIMSPIISLGLVIIFEFMFDMTTDMTLLELSDLNQPLLRRLAMHAPGTYHHSIMVGNLSEAASEAIGGNALLARVGSYYHDIGKLEKPEYFVENQTKGRNPQEKLSPSMSSLILLNHVRKGAEMAKQYGLPHEIESFINQHHGTALMSFFYQKAIEQRTDETLSENEFRYPGPRPKSIETAIVMLADAVEAASRTLKEPSPSRIRGLVEQIIDERFKSGELDDSPLTLQDLSKISEVFQKILNGIFHGRIAYPGDKETVEEKQNAAQ